MDYKILHTGRRIKVALHESTNPDGVLIRRDVVLHPGAVAILPLLDDGSVCLLKNHRFIFQTELWEIPAGTLEPNEIPDHAAERELAEETGYKLTGPGSSLQKIGEFIPSPGVMSEVIHLYVAKGLTKGEMALEDDEQMEPVKIPWETALAWTLDGTIKDAKTITALLLWDHRIRNGIA